MARWSAKDPSQSCNATIHHQQRPFRSTRHTAQPKHAALVPALHMPLYMGTRLRCIVHLRLRMQCGQQIARLLGLPAQVLQGVQRFF